VSIYENKNRATGEVWYNGSMNTQTLILAGGCFWCVEHDLRQAIGVTEVISGYTGDTEENANYEKVSAQETKHREAIEVTYDTSITTYRALVQFFIDHIDPTDSTGQFADKGYQYQPAIYYANEEEKEIAKDILQELKDSHMYDEDIVVAIEERKPFYKAEEYHQNYSEKNKVHYALYRQGSGRESFVNKTCALREEKKIEWKQEK
jgi:peptide-methionine (S)-S-oxide reductase